jgi:L-asparaginase II
MVAPVSPSADVPVVAEVVRSGFVESRHRGSVVAVGPDGTVLWEVGPVGSPIYPRSSNKPLQATAMVRNGLPLRGRLLALACGSHSGESEHITGVREILTNAGLDESALQTPADYPLDELAREDWIRGGGRREPIAMNCSGKHAGMLATCTANGWDTDHYLRADHPLQARIVDVFAELTSDRVDRIGVDGCGAPLLATSLVGLARAFSRLVQAPAGSPEGAVAAAIAGDPVMVSGSRRDEPPLLRALPGSIGKSGAEACHAFALPDGTAVALKIEDGADRARPVVLAGALRRLGLDADVLEGMGRPRVLGGGQPVGEVRATF